MPSHSPSWHRFAPSDSTRAVRAWGFPWASATALSLSLAACGGETPEPSPEVHLPSLAALLKGHEVEPLPQIGDRLDPGTLLKQSDGRLYLAANIDQAYDNPAALRTPQQTSLVVAAVDCEDSYTVEATGGVKVLGLVGLGQVQVSSSAEAIRKVRTHLKGLERVDVSLASFEEAKLKQAYQAALDAEEILLALVVWRVQEFEVSFHTKSGAKAAVEVSGVAASGNASGSVEHVTNNTLRFQNKVIGYYPALRILLQHPDDASATNEDAERIVKALDAANIKARFHAGGVIVDASPQQARLVRAVVAETRERRQALREKQEFSKRFEAAEAQRVKLETQVRDLDQMRLMLDRDDIQRILKAGLPTVADHADVARKLRLRGH